MKVLQVIATVLFSAMLFAQSNPTVVHGNGAFASLTTVSNGSNINLNINSGTDSSGQQTTFLFFNIFTFNSDGTETSIAGTGFIPNGAFSGGNPANLSLNLDTSQITGFQTTTCNVDITTFTVTCADGPTGVIAINWKPDGAFSVHSVSTTQVNFSQFTFQSHGESDQTSATANGTLVGFSLTDASGQAGTNHNKSMSLVRN